MYCSKCGTKAIDGAVFCQKCGAELIQNDREEEKPASVLIRESVEVPILSAGAISELEQKSVKKEESLFEGESVSALASEPVKTASVPTEAIMKTVQEADAHEESSATSGSDVGIYALLEENIDKCPVIKSAKQVKKGVRLRAKIYNHYVRLVTVHTVQARLQSVLAFPFSILYVLLAGLFCTITGVILQELMKYGSICIEYYHGILFALCFLVTGATVLIHSFVGQKEKSAVAAYIREIVEPKSIYLSDKRRAGAFKVRTAVAIIMVVAGIIILPFNLPSPIKYPDELLFDGLPAVRFLDMTQRDIEAEYGEEKFISKNRITSDDYYNYYDGFRHITYSKESGKVIYIEFTGSHCAYNRKNLDKSMERVLDILDDGYWVNPMRLSFGVYGSIHSGFYYDDGVYFGDTLDVMELLAQQEFEDNRDYNYRFYTLRAWGEIQEDYSIGFREMRDDYEIALITADWKNYDKPNELYYVCLYTDEWVETVNARKNAIDLSYRGESLAKWIGGLPENAYDVFGWPDSGTIVDGYLYEGGEYFGYTDGVLFVMDYQTGQIGWIIGDTSSIIGNGYTLDKTRDELIEILGTPMMEEYAYNDMDDTSSYYMQYTLDSVELLINMPDVASRAETFIISQIVE